MTCLPLNCGNSRFVSWYLLRGSAMILAKGGLRMDQQKTGNFLKCLRREKGLTQEQLAEHFHVSSRTVSRWENGNYMPDIEMLSILSKQFNISINELLIGERVLDQEFRKKADENIVAMAKTTAFSLEDKKRYFKKKWRREHIFLFLVLGAILVLSILLPIWFERPWFLGLTPLIALIEYGYQNNQMMIYLEHCLYD